MATVPVLSLLHVRPLLQHEEAAGCRSIVAVGEGEVVTVQGRPYAFDCVVGEGAHDRSHMCSAYIQPIVRNVCSGINCAVFAYGQTSSGKTYTMGIGREQLAELAEGGSSGAEDLVIPYALRQLFRTVEAAAGARNFTLLVSFVEVYMEKYYDLLAQRSPVAAKTSRDGEVMLVGCQLRHVTTMEQVVRLLQIGGHTRITKGTSQNDRSSRSHAVLTIHVQSRPLPGVAASGAPASTPSPASGPATPAPSTPPPEPGAAIALGAALAAPPLSAKLHLVDLAGSESVGRAGAVGLAAKEGNTINLSLMTLRTLIQMLAAPRPAGGAAGAGSPGSAGAAPGTTPGSAAAPAQRVLPYRDSKLTTLLRDALGGNSSTLFIACCSPADVNAAMTVSTLEFATTARKIRTKPAVNIGGAGSAEVLELHRIISKLRAEVEQLRRQLASQGPQMGALPSALTHGTPPLPLHLAAAPAPLTGGLNRRRADDLMDWTSPQLLSDGGPEEDAAPPSPPSPLLSNTGMFVSSPQQPSLPQQPLAAMASAPSNLPTESELDAVGGETGAMADSEADESQALPQESGADDSGARAARKQACRAGSGGGGGPGGGEPADGLPDFLSKPHKHQKHAHTRTGRHHHHHHQRHPRVRAGASGSGAGLGDGPQRSLSDPGDAGTDNDVSSLFDVSSTAVGGGGVRDGWSQSARLQQRLVLLEAENDHLQKQVGMLSAVVGDLRAQLDEAQAALSAASPATPPTPTLSGARGGSGTASPGADAKEAAALATALAVRWNRVTSTGSGGDASAARAGSSHCTSAGGGTAAPARAQEQQPKDAGAEGAGAAGDSGEIVAMDVPPEAAADPPAAQEKRSSAASSAAAAAADAKASTAPHDADVPNVECLGDRPRALLAWIRGQVADAEAALAAKQAELAGLLAVRGLGLPASGALPSARALAAYAAQQVAGAEAELRSLGGMGAAAAEAAGGASRDGAAVAQAPSAGASGVADADVARGLLVRERLGALRDVERGVQRLMELESSLELQREVQLLVGAYAGLYGSDSYGAASGPAVARAAATAEQHMANLRHQRRLQVQKEAAVAREKLRELEALAGPPTPHTCGVVVGLPGGVVPMPFASGFAAGASGACSATGGSGGWPSAASTSAGPTQRTSSNGEEFTVGSFTGLAALELDDDYFGSEGCIVVPPIDRTPSGAAGCGTSSSGAAPGAGPSGPPPSLAPTSSAPVAQATEKPSLFSNFLTSKSWGRRSSSAKDASAPASPQGAAPTQSQQQQPNGAGMRSGSMQRPPAGPQRRQIRLQVSQVGPWLDSLLEYETRLHQYGRVLTGALQERESVYGELQAVEQDLRDLDTAAVAAGFAGSVGGSNAGETSKPNSGGGAAGASDGGASGCASLSSWVPPAHVAGVVLGGEVSVRQHAAQLRARQAKLQARLEELCMDVANLQCQIVEAREAEDEDGNGGGSGLGLSAAGSRDDWWRCVPALALARPALRLLLERAATFKVAFHEAVERSDQLEYQLSELELQHQEAEARLAAHALELTATRSAALAAVAAPGGLAGSRASVMTALAAVLPGPPSQRQQHMQHHLAYYSLWRESGAGMGGASFGGGAAAATGPLPPSPGSSTWRSLSCSATTSLASTPYGNKGYGAALSGGTPLGTHGSCGHSGTPVAYGSGMRSDSGHGSGSGDRVMLGAGRFSANASLATPRALGAALAAVASGGGTGGLGRVAEE